MHHQPSCLIFIICFCRCYSYPAPLLQPVASQPSEYPGEFVKHAHSQLAEPAPLEESQECAFLTSSGAMPCCCPHDDTPIPFLFQRTTSLEMLVHALGMPSPIVPTLYQRPRGAKGRPGLLLPLCSGFFHPIPREGSQEGWGNAVRRGEVEDIPMTWWLFHSTRGKYGVQTPANLPFFLYRSSCCPWGPQKERQTWAKTGFLNALAK